MMSVKRGEIYYADLSPVVGSEQGGIRPVLIVQNDIGNKHSPTVIAAAITSRTGKSKLPTHIEVYADRYSKLQLLRKGEAYEEVNCYSYSFSACSNIPTTGSLCSYSSNVRYKQG